MTFEDQLHALIFFHLQAHESPRDLVQYLKEDDFAKDCIAPDGGISRSTFSEAINFRGLEQFQYIFQELCKKAKGHFGFDVNRKIPMKVYLTEGNGAERPFVSSILSEGQTGIMDRGYQSHKSFDDLQDENKHFVCRIKARTTRTVINQKPVDQNSHVFYDALVLLGTRGVNQSKTPVLVVGYTIAGVNYYVATDRHDLTAEQVGTVYKLRWDIETFFKCWKKHLKVYHLIAPSEYGLMVQILGGLISYLLMAIYCHEQFNETVSIKRIRQLKSTIRNELRVNKVVNKSNPKLVKDQESQREVHAKI